MWRATREQRKQQQTELVHIGADRHRLASELLGGRVRGRHDTVAGQREPGVPARVVQPLRNPEVEELHVSVFVHEDIRRLEIAMDDEIAVRVLDGLAHLAEQAEAPGEVERVRFAVLVQRHALDQFHHEVRRPLVGHPAAEQPGDVWVAQTGQGFALPREAALRAGGSVRPVQLFDSHRRRIRVMHSPADVTGSRVTAP
jgi:hypothetical protein